MNELEKNILLDLINEHGINELEKVLNITKEILNYIQEIKTTYTINESSRKLLYIEENEKQIFTNCRTSIFCLNEKIFNFEKLKLNPKILPRKIELSKKENIDKFFDTSKRYFGNSWYSSVSLINDHGFTYYKIGEELTTISLNEYKLIRLLLKNPKIYVSCKNSILKAEGENGYAYVLGYKKGSQLVF